MKTKLVIFFLYIFSCANAQLMDVEYGRINEEEREMKNYEKDEDAKAVVLFDKGEVNFVESDNTFKVVLTRHKRIKVFDYNDLQSLSIVIPYYSDGKYNNEIIKSLEANIFNFENETLVSHKLDPSNIHEVFVNPFASYKKITFPDIQDGSILEYRSVIELPYYNKLPEWVFQDRFPTIYSEYKINSIPFYEYQLITQGFTKFDFYDSFVTDKRRNWGNVTELLGRNVGGGVVYNDKVHVYVLKDIPEIKLDTYITNFKDNLIKMNFYLARIHREKGYSKEIISTWPDLNKALLMSEEFGVYIEKCSRYAMTIVKNEFDFEGLAETEKAQLIIDYVKNNYTWNSRYSKYASQSPKDFLKSKIGNVADINLFMIALLNAANIDTQPVVLSTRDHGKIHVEYPFNKFTNYVIALVNVGASFMADGTEQLLRYNALPIRCFNENGLVVNKEDETLWVNLSTKISSLENHAILLEIDTTTFDLNTTVSIQSTHYKAYTKRINFKNDTTIIKGIYTDNIGNIKKIFTSGYESQFKTYSMNFSGNWTTEKKDDSILIKPFLNLPLLENILQQKNSVFPVDLIYLIENRFVSKLEIPNGYRISTVLETFEVNDDLMEIKLNYNLENTILLTTGNYTFKKAVYSPEEYSSLKNHLDMIVKHFNEALILEKDN